MNQTLLAKWIRLFDETPEADQPILLAELVKRILARQPARTSLSLHDTGLELRDADDRAVAFLVPRSAVFGTSDLSDEEFIELAKRRIANPNTRFVTMEEFFALLESDASRPSSHSR